MNPKIVYTVLLLLYKNYAKKDGVGHKSIKRSCIWDDRYRSLIILSTIVIFQLSIMSVSSILNDSKVGDEETVYSLKGSFCLIEELFYTAIKVEQATEDDL